MKANLFQIPDSNKFSLLGPAKDYTVEDYYVMLAEVQAKLLLESPVSVQLCIAKKERFDPLITTALEAVKSAAFKYNIRLETKLCL